MTRNSPLEENSKLQIVKLYNNNLTISQISQELFIPIHTIRRALIQKSCKLRSYSDYRWAPSEETKTEIIRLYTKEKRGIQFFS